MFSRPIGAIISRLLPSLIYKTSSLFVFRVDCFCFQVFQTESRTSAMASYGRIRNPLQRPEAVLQRAEEFISVNKKKDALAALHEIIKVCESM